MILIADSGSTKCDWVILDKSKKVILKTSTQGINPRLLSVYQICNIIHSAKELNESRVKINKVLFYGAGCGSDQARANLARVLSDFFLNAEIVIEEDLTAAVHATTEEPGVVCILGTGSNCCYFDGENIQIHQASLGYLIMDEGSGNYFGKKLLRSYFYNKMPSDLKKKFEEGFDLSLEKVLSNLYESENPSAYLAKYAHFLVENRHEAFIHSIIVDGIKDLFNNLISCYQEELISNPIYFVGSIAYYLQEEILLEATKRGIKVRSFVKKPMDNIITSF